MTEPGMSDAPVSVAPPKAAAWEDVLDIFYAPTEVFERRRDGKYLIAMLVLAACTRAARAGALSLKGEQRTQQAQRRLCAVFQRRFTVCRADCPGSPADRRLSGR